VAVGTGIGARHNILIKDAATLENVSRIESVVLDKTGTLTEGEPSLTDVFTLDGRSEEELLRLVAPAEKNSEHPLAEAIVAGARERGIEPGDAARFESVAGHGIRAEVDGHAVLVGNRKLMDEGGVDVFELEEKTAALAEACKTPMFVAVDGEPSGLLAVADTLKPSARDTMQRLEEMGIEAVMITGDNKRTAEAVARELGIGRVFSEVLPADKARYVQQLQAEGKRVAMVGDGVNDAPALAQADIGIAIGAGTDVAIETAKVVLMKSDPLDVTRAVVLSKATVRKMKQNLVWASVYNVLAIPVAAGLLFPAYGIMLRPEWSALLMSLSSIIVAVNAVLLKGVEDDLDEPRPGALRSEPDPGDKRNSPRRSGTDAMGVDLRFSYRLRDNRRRQDGRQRRPGGSPLARVSSNPAEPQGPSPGRPTRGRDSSSRSAVSRLRTEPRVIDVSVRGLCRRRCRQGRESATTPPPWVPTRVRDR